MIHDFAWNPRRGTSDIVAVWRPGRTCEGTRPCGTHAECPVAVETWSAFLGECVRLRREMLSRAHVLLRREPGGNSLDGWTGDWGPATVAVNIASAHGHEPAGTDAASQRRALRSVGAVRVWGQDGVLILAVEDQDGEELDRAIARPLRGVVSSFVWDSDGLISEAHADAIERFDDSGPLRQAHAMVWAARDGLDSAAEHCDALDRLLDDADAWLERIAATYHPDTSRIASGLIDQWTSNLDELIAAAHLIAVRADEAGGYSTESADAVSIGANARLVGAGTMEP